MPRKENWNIVVSVVGIAEVVSVMPWETCTESDGFKSLGAFNSGE